MSGTHLDDLEADERWPLLARFRQYGWPYKHLLAVSLLSRGGSLVLASAVPAIFGKAIDGIFTDVPYELPLVPAAWIPADPLGQLFFTAGLILGLRVVQAPMGYLHSYVGSVFGEHLIYEIKTDAYETIQDLDVSFFEAQQTGEIMSVLNNDVDQLEQTFTDMLQQLSAHSGRLLGSAGFMVLLNWQLALLMLLFAPGFAAAFVHFRKRFQQAFTAVREVVGKLNARFEDNIGGIQVIKANTAESFESERVAKSSYAVFEKHWGAAKLQSTFWPVVQLMTQGSFILTLVVGGYWVIVGPPGPLTGTLTGGELVAFLIYSRDIRWPIRSIAMNFQTYKQGTAAAERIATIQRTDLTLDEPADAVELDAVDGRVRYDDITFAYDDEPVLEEIDLDVSSGDTVGLVGPTGAGKSTLVKLLLRFYDVDEGAILIDGHDVRDVTVRSLRDNIGYVAQEPYLFSGTVRENIAYGSRDATDGEIREAARAAKAHEFITDLPEGYDTEVGERGVKLSGGQRQRIAIARALVRDPAIMIFDEATSHVDNETEILIQDSLAEITADRTTFLVAHRLSTVRNADEIVVLEDGQVAERGTHEELVANEGQYAALWGVQVGDVSSVASDQ